jgi:lysophospholipase L1-like esterase
VAIVLFFLVQAWFLIRGKRIAPLLLGMAHATLVAVLLGTYIAPRLLEPDLERANTLTHYHWSGSRLPRDLLWYLHPLCRRWNEFLANRTFRSRTVRLQKEGGSRRVLCLGTSSTYGHGFTAEERADYPAQLSEMLEDADGGQQVEVINAAVPGSTGARLLAFFRDVLCQYQPDVLVLSLAFNDAASLSQADERSYYLRITSPDHEASFLERLRERFSMRWHQRGYLANRDLFAEGREAQIKRGAGERNAPRLFALVLGDYLHECRARGVKLLLIEEPVRSPVYLVDELHQAMARFASDQGVPVLDPRPALELAGGKERFQDEVHPDRIGHQVIAEQLARALFEQKIL